MFPRQPRFRMSRRHCETTRRGVEGRRARRKFDRARIVRSFVRSFDVARTDGTREARDGERRRSRAGKEILKIGTARTTTRTRWEAVGKDPRSAVRRVDTR